MACTSPPELNDRELLTYIDSEADDRVVAHLEQCPSCREKACRLACLQNCLTTQLYRITCPSPVELGEYHLGMLPQDRMAAVDQHLSECPHCTREGAQLKDFLADLKPDLEPGPLEQIKRQIRVLVARLVNGELKDDLLVQPTLSPAYAGVRGEREEPYLYQADDVQIAVEVQDDAERPGRKVILGLVLRAESDGLEVHLWRAEQRVAVVSVDELGNFVIPDLAPGSYELILSGLEVEIHIQELQVGTS
ncbi:MAG: zf-HC2 domain-containing protein [Chloroflexota bacterium]|nr:zf-HC2 domain-containing protein [Chloroflexota bacterium]